MFIDVIGLVVAIGEMGIDNDDVKKHRLNIQIQDAKFVILYFISFFGY